MFRPNWVWRSYRKNLKTAKKSVGADLLKILKTQIKSEWDPKRWNKTDGIYEFRNGSIYCLEGCDDVDKLTSVSQDDAHFCEAIPEIEYGAAQEVFKRTTNQIYGDYNPRAKKHWWYRFVEGRPDNEVTYYHSTFRDNPFLPQAQIQAILDYEPTPENIAKGTADKQQWSIYGLGEPCSPPGAIFNKWDVTEDWPDRMKCEKYWFSLDFGYSNPTALMECALFQNRIWVREMIYERELIAGRARDPSIKSIAGMLDEILQEKMKLQKENLPPNTYFNKTDIIWCDQAHPDQIAELKACGYNAIGSPKTKSVTGDNYVQACIKRFLQYFIWIHVNSPNTQEEFENWTRKKDPLTDEFTEEPEDEWNHAIKAMFYGGMQELPLTEREYWHKRQVKFEQKQYSVYDNLYKNKANSRRRRREKQPWEQTFEEALAEETTKGMQ